MLALVAAGVPPSEVRTDADAKAERRAVGVLLQHYGGMQASYATSVEGDEQLLLEAGGLGLSARYQQAIRWVVALGGCDWAWLRLVGRGGVPCSPGAHGVAWWVCWVWLLPDGQLHL
jgi:hypothetical protein